jgi:hypothetical protein
VVILGEPGVVWTQPGKVGLTVLGNAEIEIRNLVMTDMARAIECGGFARCDLAEVEIGAMADEAAQVRGSASLHVDRSFISGSARNGIRVRDLSRLTVVNSIVTGNGLADDARGGAIVVDSQEAGVSVINSTLADNGAGDFAGGIHTVAEANVSVVNTIFWNNSDVPSECHECTLGDDSLLGMDPRFVVADGQRARAEDYRIRARSPARGGGTAGDGVPDIDYWGQLRDSTVDTGAHEFVP